MYYAIQFPLLFLHKKSLLYDFSAFLFVCLLFISISEQHQPIHYQFSNIMLRLQVFLPHLVPIKWVFFCIRPYYLINILIFSCKTTHLNWTKLGEDDPFEEEIQPWINEVDPGGLKGGKYVNVKKKILRNKQ